jgi:hypothetical protein
MNINDWSAILIWRYGKRNGIATRYVLYGPGIDSQWGRDFPNPFRPAQGPTQPNAQRLPGPFPRGKAAGEWRWRPMPSSTEAKERVELNSTPPLGLHGLL